MNVYIYISCTLLSGAHGNWAGCNFGHVCRARAYPIYTHVHIIVLVIFIIVIFMIYMNILYHMCTYFSGAHGSRLGCHFSDAARARTHRGRTHTFEWRVRGEPKTTYNCQKEPKKKDPLTLNWRFSWKGLQNTTDSKRE